MSLTYLDERPGIAKFDSEFSIFIPPYFEISISLTTSCRFRGGILPPIHLDTSGNGAGRVVERHRSNSACAFLDTSTTLTSTGKTLSTGVAVFWTYLCRC